MVKDKNGIQYTDILGNSLKRRYRIDNDRNNIL